MLVSEQLFSSYNRNWFYLLKLCIDAVFTNKFDYIMEVVYSETVLQQFLSTGIFRLTFRLHTIIMMLD